MGLLIQGDWDWIANPIKLKAIIKQGLYGLRIMTTASEQHYSLIQVQIQCYFF